MSSDEVDDVPVTHDAARLRGPRRLLVIGSIVSFVLAFASSALGTDGELGMVTLLLLLAITFGSAGVWLGGALLVDEFRDEPTSNGRGLRALGYFLIALICMVAVGGLTEVGP